MSKNCISISKNYFEKVEKEIDNVSMKMSSVISSLQSISSNINLTVEEIETLKNARNILISKLETIEELTEDPTNEFFNAENQEHDF